MGLFDGLAGQLLSSLGPGAGRHESLLPHVLDLLQGNSGGKGIHGLVDAFNSKGLGNLMSSWISTGPNLPVSGQQIQQTLDSGLLNQLASKAGIAPEAISFQLADLLPNVIDKLTPNGSLPQGGDILSEGLSMLKGKLF
jgi:uncharacterized protein YidB (DUF937 family)